MEKMKICEHGAECERHKLWPEELAFTEPLVSCSCCGSLFYWINSVMGPMLHPDEGGKMRAYLEGQSYEPEDRCQECGGHYVPFKEPWSSQDPKPEPSLLERLASFKAKKEQSSAESQESQA